MKQYLIDTAAQYRSILTENIMPFWIQKGMDAVNGGLYTSFTREGELMDTTKSVWFQGRFGFIAAYAYNRIERRSEWLAASKSCIDFIEAHCFDPADGRMYFEVMADGTPLRKRRYVFSECFAAIAMSEYAIASGDQEYARKALRLFTDIQRFIATPELTPAKSLPTQPAIGHSITMILINTASCIRRAIADPVLDAQIQQSLDTLQLFMQPEYKALLEMVTPDGKLIDTCAGRTINPGHCIETAWFLLEEARRRDWEPELTKMATTILDWSWDWGWDREFGGVINFRDCKGYPQQDYSQDMKFWWPQCETVIATLYAYRATGDAKYLRQFTLANEWMLAHLPDSEYPEWYGYLHRDGTVAQAAKGNLFKGPFHIPRMLIVASQLADEIAAGM